MSQSLVNQITLDCLLNKEMIEKHLMKQKEQQLNKEELKFYKKRIINLFKDIINNNSPENLSPDVKYAYNMLIESSIEYFKILDNNDLLQEEYNNLNLQLDDYSTSTIDTSINYIEADKLLMRSVKMDVPTLDKYVKRISNKKEINFILPKLREVNIMQPELKEKGVKKEY